MQLTAAEMERLLQYTRVKSIDIRLETDTGEVFVVQCAPGTASLTMSHLPQELDFLGDPFAPLLGRPYIALVMKPDGMLGDQNQFRISHTGKLPS